MTSPRAETPLAQLRRKPSDYARNRFRLGDRVRLSNEGRAMFPRFGTATIVGFCRQDDLVNLRRDRRVQVESWHIDLLEAVPKER